MMNDACAQSANASQVMNLMSSFRAVVSARVTPEFMFERCGRAIRSILLCSSTPCSNFSSCGG